MTNNYEAIALASSTEVLDDKNEFMFKVLNEANRWIESEVELAQGRSDFQIEKFIVHDSFTIPSAFKSALINPCCHWRWQRIQRCAGRCCWL